MRRYLILFALIVLGFSSSAFAAETYRLANGDTLVGEVLPTSANDAGVQVKLGEGKYERIPWANFSQEDLKKFSANSRLKELVEPFIEITAEEKIRRTEVNIDQPQRFPREPDRSLIVAMAGSGFGVFVLLLIYLANLYAAYEISIFRARPLALVLGVSAVLPIIGPIIFLSMPTLLLSSAPAVETLPPEEEIAAAAEVNPMLVEGAENPGGLHIHHEEAKTKVPETVTFQRGQFTFNRRFFETKFPGFFGAVRRDADKDMVLVFRTAKGEFTGTQISRISANDLHLQAIKGAGREEVTIPFGEIQEIKLKHTSAA